ncbi:methionine--tRNA ligase, mitochondrial-like isoform X2 [Dysidea avara]|uniref:methionine--tRNA ligase, mitochondrial-like isoform X2 n=1 Tax=Dysidea avara TaxID=196820 RepID=UPI0033261F76
MVPRVAREMGMSPEMFCRRATAKFQHMLAAANINNDKFICTTSPAHQQTVYQLWDRLEQNGFIYRGSYEGWYSVNDEAFYSSDDVTTNDAGVKVSVETNNPVEWTIEDNYKFRLSNMEERLLQWASQPDAIIPKMSREMVLSWINQGLKDLSISRPSSRVPWGIPTPHNTNQTVYVWFDALCNYLTVAKQPFTNQLSSSLWPHVVHLVGKDILRFHAVYWPAFLMAADLAPPKRVVSHAHWTVGKVKMSKSLGNVVDPITILDQYGVDAVRYFFLKDGRLEDDSDFTENRITSLLNTELADNLGNMLNRVTGVKVNPSQTYPPFHIDLFPLNATSSPQCRAGSEDYELLNTMNNLTDEVSKLYNDFKFGMAITKIMECVQQGNAFLQRHQPWVLIKQPEEQPWLDTVLHTALECVRLCCVLLYPIVPQSMTEVRHRLGLLTDITTQDLQCRLNRTFINPGSEHIPGASTKLNSCSKLLFKKFDI